MTNQVEEERHESEDAHVAQTTGVEKEEEHGAWGKDKAPLNLITEFMALMQSENTQQAIVLANEIIVYEPNNAIIQQLLPLLKQKQELSLENDEDDDDDEEFEDSDESSDSSSEEEEDENIKESENQVFDTNADGKCRAKDIYPMDKKCSN